MPTDVSLSDFLDGVFNVLAFRGQRRVPLPPNVFEEALADTVASLEKHAKREKLRLAFRVRPGALENPRSELSAALRQMQKAGTFRKHLVPKPNAELLPTPDAAYGNLAATPLPIGFLDRAAKLLYRRLQVGQIRQSLAGIAQRPKISSPPKKRPRLWD